MKKIKYIILLMFTALTAFNGNAQGIDTLFIVMPDAVFPLLNNRQRLEMVKNYKAEQNDTVENALGGQSFMELCDNEHIKLQSSATSSFEIFRYRDLKNKPIVGIIRTSCAPVCSSEVAFYSTTWKPIKLPLPPLRAADWIDREKLAATDYTFEEIEKLLNINFIEYVYNAESRSIEAINHSLEYLDAQERKKIETLMKAAVSSKQ